MRRSVAVCLLTLLGLSTGCRLISLGVTCERDDNCRDAERCVAGLCAREPDASLTADAGDADDAGPPLPACPDPAAEPERRLVLTEDLEVYDQGGLAALEGILVIEGDVRIFGGSDVTRVDLPELAEVTGRLVLDPGVTAAPLYAVSLPCLTRVGQDLVIDGDVVESFALPRLQEVGRALTVEDGFTAPSLPSLTRVGATLTLEQTLATSVSGFPELSDVSGLALERNEELVDVSGLDGLFSFSLGLRVIRNAKLASLGPLAEVGFVEGNLIIRDNPVLPSCEAEALRDSLVDSGFRGPAVILGNDERAVCPWFASLACPPVLSDAPCVSPANLTLASVADVDAAQAVTCVNDLVIAIGVSEVCLPALKEIVGTLTLGDGNTATRIELPALEEAGALYGSAASLLSLSLPRLTSTSALELFSLPVLQRAYLPRLETLLGPLRLRDSATPLVYAPQLRHVGGELELVRLTSATAVFFPWLSDVEGVLRVRESPALSRLGALRSLNEVNGLEVVQNAALQDLEDLGLQRIFGNVLIDQNDALTTLDAIPQNVAFSGVSVTVSNNPCLPQADAQTWAEALSPGTNFVTNNGTATCQ